MAKLYFYYGPMGSMKTAKAIITAHNYKEQGFKPLVFTSALDNRFGTGKLASRVPGLECEAIPLTREDDFRLREDVKEADVIIVDEAQFLTADQVTQLAAVVDVRGIDVLCYGLRTDFTTCLFEGSNRLMALADVIREEIAMCSCGRKATVNARLVNGKVTIEGEQVVVGASCYKPMCRKCWCIQLVNNETAL